ncbi:MAG TPA: potassium channel family protein [Candidatus Thermoplasmatota archaeon]|nr:potassium channel family protein [Candidatus Thermoplasmatota archaeon]
MRPATRTPRRQLARDLLLIGLALVSVGIGIAELSEPDAASLRWLEIVDLAIVAVFWVDFMIESRRVGLRLYVRTHWWELPSLIPLFPALIAAAPPLALVRIVRVLRLVRVVGVLLRLRPVGAYVVRLARSARIDIILGVAAAIVAVGTVLAYAVESRANEHMASWGQALWFAFNMFTNVAYLDFQPVTLGGRVLAGFLQLCGIAFIGLFTASLASAIVKEPKVDEK